MLYTSLAISPIMVYLYFAAGKSKPYFIAHKTTSSVTTQGLQPNAAFPNRAGIFIKMEFGVTSNGSRVARKPVAIGYSSRNVLEDVYGRSNSVYPDGGSHAQLMVPRSGRHQMRTRSATQLRITPIPSLGPEPHLSHHEPAQTYAPQPRTQAIIIPPPVAPLYPHPFRSQPAVTQTAGSLSTHEQMRHASRQGQAPQRQRIVQRNELTPLPSSFRLSERDLPWATSSDYSLWSPEQSSTSLLADPSPFTINAGILSPNSYPISPEEDPQRRRELAALHSAMMTIDSMENDWWEPAGSWVTADDGAQLPRGPGSLGWAIRVEPEYQVPEHQVPGLGYLDEPNPLSPPPVYAKGNWVWENREYYSSPALRRRRSG